MGQKDSQIRAIQRLMLNRRRWVFLRYWHARQAMKLMHDCKSVLVVGGGFALAEVALALEYSEVQFYVTDHPGASHDFKRARELKAEFGVENINFGVLDILKSDIPEGSYDAVYSVEVLEHIELSEVAAAQMCKIARNYVFCLVPYADAETNANESKRERALATHEHFVCGFDAKTLRRYFPGESVVRGVYWSDGGKIMRNELEALKPDEIKANYERWLSMAADDARDAVPEASAEAQGIFIVSRLRAH
jgi:hypothetical protein